MYEENGLLTPLRNLFIEALSLSNQSDLITKIKIDKLILDWNKEIEYINKTLDNWTSKKGLTNGKNLSS